MSVWSSCTVSYVAFCKQVANAGFASRAAFATAVAATKTGRKRIASFAWLDKPDALNVTCFTAIAAFVSVVHKKACSKAVPLYEFGRSLVHGKRTHSYALQAGALDAYFCKKVQPSWTVLLQGPFLQLRDDPRPDPR